MVTSLVPPEDEPRHTVIHTIHYLSLSKQEITGIVPQPVSKNDWAAIDIAGPASLIRSDVHACVYFLELILVVYAHVGRYRDEKSCSAMDGAVHQIEARSSVV